jgi:hypothetical protein
LKYRIENLCAVESSSAVHIDLSVLFDACRNAVSFCMKGWECMGTRVTWRIWDSTERGVAGVV